MHPYALLGIAILLICALGIMYTRRDRFLTPLTPLAPLAPLTKLAPLKPIAPINGGTPATTDDSADKSSDMPTWQIILIVLGCCSVVVGVIALAGWKLNWFTTAAATTTVTEPTPVAPATEPPPAPVAATPAADPKTPPVTDPKTQPTPVTEPPPATDPDPETPPPPAP